MRASQTVHVLIKVHHLEAIELVRDLLDLFLLSRLNDFDTLCIPVLPLSDYFLISQGSTYHLI